MTLKQVLTWELWNVTVLALSAIPPAAVVKSLLPQGKGLDLELLYLMWVLMLIQNLKPTVLLWLKIAGTAKFPLTNTTNTPVVQIPPRPLKHSLLIINILVKTYSLTLKLSHLAKVDMTC